MGAEIYAFCVFLSDGADVQGVVDYCRNGGGCADVADVFVRWVVA